MRRKSTCTVAVRYRTRTVQQNNTIDGQQKRLPPTFIESLGNVTCAEPASGHDNDDGDRAAAAASVPIYVATQEDIDNGTFTPWDVVLPVPGAGVVLPQHEDGRDAAAIISAVSSLCGVEVDATTGRWSLFEADRNEMGLQVCGTYRYILEYPRDFSLQVTKHREEVSVKNKDGVVSASDLLHQSNGADAESTTEKERTKEIQRDPSSYRLTLNFALPSSAFPSMLIREFCGAVSGHGCRWDALQKICRSNTISHLDARADEVGGDGMHNLTRTERLKQLLQGAQDAYTRRERLTETERKRLETLARQSAFSKNAHGGRAIHEARITNAIFYSPSHHKQFGTNKPLKNIKEILPITFTK